MAGRTFVKEIIIIDVYEINVQILTTTILNVFQDIYFLIISVRHFINI